MQEKEMWIGAIGFNFEYRFMIIYLGKALI
jgi:hypothetical protein